MEFLQSFQSWVKGELLQAKFMLFFGIIMLICLIFILRSNDQFIRGLTIPLGLTIIALIGYGGFIIPDRNKRLSIIETELNKELPPKIIKEKRKIEEGIATCKTTIRIWSAIAVSGIILFFLFSNSYYKGIAIGVIILGFSLLLIDVFIDNRAKKLYPNFDKIELRE